MVRTTRREWTRRPVKRPTRRSSNERLRARAMVYLKDPLVSQNRAVLYKYVYVDKDTCIDVGPTSSRFTVIDYDPQNDRVERAAKPFKQRIRGERVLEFKARPGTPQEAQINAWATAVDTLDLFQQPLALGREVPWAFEGSRLRILPHAGYEANAFYSRQTRALHFGYFQAKGDGATLIQTALSHDVVAHETAHAVLDGLRPFYLEATEPDTPAFHEFIGDLAAMLSIFRDRAVIAEIGREPLRQKGLRELAAALAPQVGSGIYGAADRSFLRTAENSFTYNDVRNDTEIHRRSQVLTGFSFDALEAMFAIRLKALQRRATRRDYFVELLSTTTRAMVRMFLRPLDFLPPGNVQFPEYAGIVLYLDRQAYPNDDLGFRAAVERVMKRRGIFPTKETNLPQVVENSQLVDRNIDLIRSSRVGAYRFLEANREAFGIPLDVDFRVSGLATNRRVGDRGLRPPPETIIQYTWNTYLKLSDADASTRDRLVLHSGGTLVVDDQVNVLYWLSQKYDEKRTDRIRRHVRALLREGTIGMDLGPAVRSERPIRLVRDQAGNAHLALNTARMHEGRPQ